jgi:ABC-2 type transport system ATP-binding protein
VSTIEVTGLVKRYGRRIAVDGFEMTAGAGDIVGLLGPNGAGKTTIIRVLTTVLAASAGEFAIAGAPHTQPSLIRQRIGVLPESGGYRADQSGLELLVFHARLHGMSRPEAGRAAALRLAQVGLSDRGTASIGTYSRGMRQRLGIARALLNDPAVVFLDEPTLGLDPAGQNQINDIITDIAARGTTVVLSTHDLPEVEQLCNRVLILSRGRILTAGTVAEIIAAAAGPRSARIRVSPAHLDDAATVLRRTFAGSHPMAFDIDAERPHTLALTVSADAGELSPALRALIEAGVEVVGLELDAPRLSEAFLQLTEAAPGALTEEVAR